ncbi:DUF2993 domain-containing protein [Fortiea sp. LEGE XX443]|uniref:LmeA family phospholipid-binding protein n=1 Tax=Fortiea sp. LEGE XX443 TaxID=1828611 RepID=UPI00187F917C|nr:DUF2993 domain-containing protein [Fortiea sp. LEGE XX443]MBE9006970.1 DUF2993 domain-containing protein [Fortiea sp. LEGE XX443]
MPEERRLEENLLSQEAERRLSNQLDEAEHIDVDVHTDLFKIVQGQADAVSVSGQGLVIKENIRVQEIKLQTDSIAVNPLSAIFGQIELNKPVNAIARIILTESDINQALNSDLVRSYAKKYDLDVEGEMISFGIQDMQLFLPGDGKIKFQGTLQLEEKRNTRLLSFIARFCPRTHTQPIMLESFDCTQGNGVSLELIVAVMQKLKKLVNLPYFTWEGTKLKIISLEVKQQNMIVFIETQVRQIPPAFTEISN